VSPGWATFLFEAANFLLLAALLGWAFFRPVRAALEQRRIALETERREAAEAREAAQRELREAAARRSEIESSLSPLRDRARREAEREAEQLLATAREQANQEREALKAQGVALRRGQAAERAADAAGAARQIVAGLLERIDGPELEGALVEHARRQLAELAAAGPLTPVMVESAQRLGAGAIATLAAAAGLPKDALDQQVVPDLVAGLRVVTARGLVDASAAGIAAQAEHALLERLESGESGESGDG
jgi:F0F1-type ATP synthase membrane subunit b/b'